MSVYMVGADEMMPATGRGLRSGAGVCAEEMSSWLGGPRCGRQREVEARPSSRSTRPWADG